MEVIPAINCSDFGSVKERFDFALDVLNVSWVHFDVSDGKFGKANTWNKPEEFSKRYGKDIGVDMEAHLMVKNPENFIESWWKMGIKRFIIHLETVIDDKGERKEKDGSSALGNIFDFCSEYGAELMISSVPETPIENTIPYLEEFQSFQVLAVSPGPSGQNFNPLVLEKIRFLRERFPDLDIEVDGDVSPKNLLLAKKAGANLFVSGSYIFDSSDPEKAYRILKEEAEKKI